MIAYASRKAGPGGNCHFQVGTAEALDFPPDHFDVVVNSLMMHHLPADLRVPALREMRRVLRPGGTLLVVEAQVPRHGRIWRLLAHVHSFDRMARMIPHLEPLVAESDLAEITTGEAPPWLRYVRAEKQVAAG